MQQSRCLKHGSNFSSEGGREIQEDTCHLRAPAGKRKTQDPGTRDPASDIGTETEDILHLLLDLVCTQSHTNQSVNTFPLI